MTAEMPPPLEPTYESETTQGSGHNVALIAIVAFVFGVLINGYIALSVLDNGGASGASSSQESPVIVPAAATTVPTATPTPLPDRTVCSEIQGTQYRSPSEREFFLSECINQPEPTATPDPTQLPPLDGGTNTQAVQTPTPNP